MRMNEYQDKTKETAVYPEAGSGSIMAVAYVSLGLGEVGEVQGKVKKIIRDSGGKRNDEQTEAIAKELGDVLWYVARMADELGYDLDYIAQANVDKLFARKAAGTIGGSGDDR
jgi:NTP pyrophosphatase (non-canonical NTP hydrolase)